MDGFTEMLEIGREMQEKEKKMKISMEEKSKKVEINIIANLERKEERLTVSNFFKKILEVYRGQTMVLEINLSKE